MRTTYFKSNKHAIVIDEIYVYENTSYDMLKKMQQPTISRNEFIAESKLLLATIASTAEQFIVDMQEVKNGILNIQVMKDNYVRWIHLVKNLYIQLSECDVAPRDLHEWSEEILSLAGWVLDLSLLLENKSGDGEINDREKWLIDHAISNYYKSLEKLKELE